MAENDPLSDRPDYHGSLHPTNSRNQSMVNQANPYYGINLEAAQYKTAIKDDPESPPAARIHALAECYDQLSKIDRNSASRAYRALGILLGFQ